jgi:hypothetical protein
MNKVYGKLFFYPKRTFHSKIMTRNLTKNGQLLSLPCTREKNVSFPIHVVNFCKTFCTCSPSSLGQDLTVKNANFILFFHLGFLSSKWQF